MRINCQQSSGLSFLATGFAFIAIGISGQTPFSAIGLAFLGIAAGHFVKGRKH